ncbi:hypothetical protein DYB31_005790 [Aphanomyces astaci]|uniref:START domain-containing protein n=1 Tax=Aphanomyces astaci TaxID=112090 RepID=A0A397ENR3_APHAT|nr:hypothetical protein DYB31_005790 [Aphanomyces astaci]
MDDSWDVMKDLQFLIATDEQLQDELAQVCEILDSDQASTSVSCAPDEAATSAASSLLRQSSRLDEDSSSTDGVSRSKVATTLPSTLSTKRKVAAAAILPDKGKPKPMRSSVRQREEIHLLRRQINELTSRLHAKETTDVTTFDMSLWERTAKLECIEKNKAVHENEQLKDAVYQQATFIEQMQRVLRKKPRIGANIMDIHSDDWQAYKLAAQASLREAAIHAIADRQYRRMQSAFIKAGVFHRDRCLFQIQAIPQPDNSFLVEMVTHLTLDAPFRLVAAQAWQVCDGELAIDLPEGAAETFQHIDPYTVYGTLLLPHMGVQCHSNTIRKYYIEQDRHVILSRTVLEDAAVPHMSKGAVENRTMWLQVTPLPDDSNQCRFTLLQQLVWPVEDFAKEEHGLDNVVTAMKHVCFGQEVRPGTLPMAEWQMDLTKLPYPSMGAFAERGRRFVRLLKAKVNEAIESFHGQQHETDPLLE